MNAAQPRRKQRTRYETSVVEAHEGKLGKPHFSILKQAALGGSYADMAEDWSVPVGTIKSRLNRARAALAKVLAAEKEATDAN